MSGAIRVLLRVDGLVQGVGFRPFVYRLARKHGLDGAVWNTPECVFVEVEGQRDVILAFQGEISSEAPPAARVEGVTSTPLVPTGEPGFQIAESQGDRREPALVSPEVATCPDCLAEIRDPANRRYRYPFTNCTNCGPRYTIVERVPYDRRRTTMRAFPFCAACAAEYGDPADRRFHAEPNACPVCGPRVTLVSPVGERLEEGDPIEAAGRRLSRGEVLAIKGLGGFHLACDATDEAAVTALRVRKGRRHRPLAVMARDLDVVRRICVVGDREAAELQGSRRPILLLRLRDDTDPGVAPSVAPAQRTLGVMLPYTPLHHLLLEGGAPPLLVMTSGNFSGGPIVSDNGDAIRRLGPMVDALLIHDRDIANRNDDSVGRIQGDRLVLVRRSRGFAPLPVPLGSDGPPILAVGALLHDTVGFAVGRRCFLSQHVGDVETEETTSFLREVVDNLIRWLDVEPQVVVHDLHPDLPTTRIAHDLATRFRARTLGVQHHHAHLVSALAAHGHTGPCLGLVLDGTGYGTDGNIWGGEVLFGDARGYRRMGHQRVLPLPGGDAAIRHPARLAAAWVHALAPELEHERLGLWERVGGEEAAVIRRMVDRRFNCPGTSSVGRLFDAMAGLLGIRDDATYEGQPAIELEQAAWEVDGSPVVLPPPRVVASGASLVWDPAPTFVSAARQERDGVPRTVLARAFHEALARALVEVCHRALSGCGLRTVALAGGVFQNALLEQLVGAGLEAVGAQVLRPGEIPPGDGGLALGQIAVARGG